MRRDGEAGEAHRSSSCNCPCSSRPSRAIPGDTQEEAWLTGAQALAPLHPLPGSQLTTCGQLRSNRRKTAAQTWACWLTLIGRSQNPSQRMFWLLAGAGNGGFQTATHSCQPSVKKGGRCQELDRHQRDARGKAVGGEKGQGPVQDRDLWRKEAL